jgi:hypothetical protein
MEISLVTLNVWGLPWPLSRDRARRFRRLERHLAAGAYDVAGVQEAWSRCLPGVRYPSSRRDSGLAVGGRLVPDELRVVHFRAGAGTDRLKAKGVLVASYAGFSVAVTHLQAHAWHGRVRERQVAELLEALPAGPLVLMGDFNFWGDEGAALRDFADVAAGPTYLRRNPYTWSHGQRFDRIYLRDLEPVRARVLPRIFSDHQPVTATVRLRQAASTSTSDGQVAAAAPPLQPHAATSAAASGSDSNPSG